MGVTSNIIATSKSGWFRTLYFFGLSSSVRTQVLTLELTKSIFTIKCHIGG